MQELSDGTQDREVVESVEISLRYRGYIDRELAMAEKINTSTLMKRLFKTKHLDAFLENQDRLFDQPVAETREEAEAFLEDCMAEIVDSLEDVREYLEELGMDVADMSDEELEDASEVFALPDGRYLIVEG